ncbi:LHH super family [Candidatus Bealeia paramacronuclearis]|uniref:LHH super family n=1 Tax=Candidatus Bealeia paramacronuclearis TaxID=1921001 RepID=A0ABZ2C736_9PROT|nr:LHH superfamily protein [Candidatus Bealeia paramacronuclearis]
MLRIVTSTFLSMLLIEIPSLFGNPTENDTENTSSSKIRKISELDARDLEVVEPKKIKVDASFLSPKKRRNQFTCASPTSLKTPEGALKKHFLGVRKEVAKNKNNRKFIFDKENLNGSIFQMQKEVQGLIKTPEDLKVVYQEKFSSNHFTHFGVFQDVPYYLDMRLMDPQQIVIAKKNGITIFETNLERMEKGTAPFTYKVTPIVERFLNEPIVVGNPDLPWGVDYHAMLMKEQSRKRLDIHHLLKTMEDGIIPLPSDFHHGTDVGIVVKGDQVLASNISRKDAKKEGLLKEGSYYGDCLHPDFGKSKIDRKVFAKWRSDFWKYIAELIKAEKAQGTFDLNPEIVPVIKIFDKVPL